mgnify:CR=1 FL=1|jgi:hypothetical protein
MASHTIPFNATPIHIVETDFKLESNQLKTIKNLKYRTHGENNTKLSEDTHILDIESLKTIKDFISKHFNNFVDNILQVENKFYMCNSWSSLQQKGDFHPVHIHPNTIINSVLYAKIDTGELQWIIDKSPLQQPALIEYKIKEQNIFNSKSWNVPLKQGTITFFPGHIAHTSKTHDTDNERIAIVTSYWLKGNLGSAEKYNDIIA